MENIEFMPGGILIYSLSQKKIVKINSKALEIFGFESFKEFNENQGEEFEGLAASAEDLNRLRNSLTCFVESNTKNFSCIFTRIKTKNGTAVFIEDFWELVNDSDLGSLFYIFVVPLNKRVLDTYFDPITGLYTRNHFSDTLEQQRFNYLTEKSGKQRYIISFNIVRFKLFNTAFGIEGGNRCLKKIAESFREIFQCEMIARFSGDRFVIFYEEDDVVTKIQLAHERVLSLYENFYLWLEAGVYRYDGKVPVITACDFAKIACDAIHLNKEHFYCLYTERLRNELELKKYVQDNIDKAIRNGYIEIFYQPILRTLSGRLCGMEALARWNDPSHGFMPADIFIPALEESQTCYKLDAYVVEQISKSLSIRIDKGLPVVPVSLNFSIRDFELSHVSLLKILNENILKYGLSCEYIKIELSETSAIEDEKKVTGRN
ncbi:EAL domain-containing protein [Treponema zioleckii]|uniref:EAL domain-containing protein n=1 Tax=Treponema zioleckii TaxID=331680 RepID=UPI00168A84A4|nr:EAL domain-containing protein [Treponema zioleckii]